MSSSTTKECPFCAETIKAAAVLCRFCGSKLPLPATMGAPARMSSSPPPTAPSAAAPLHSSEIVDLLTSLVQKSLVVYEEDEQGRGRYRLLETVRQYGRDRLLEAQEGESVRGRHLDFFLALAEEAEPRLRSGEQEEWLALLEGEFDNLRAALAWTQADESRRELALQLAGALGWFWFLRSDLDEGWRWLQGALALAERRPAGCRGLEIAAAKTFWAAGMLAWDQSDREAARSLLDKSVKIGEEWGELRLRGYSLAWLGMVVDALGDRRTGRSLAEEAVRLLRSAGDPWGLALALNILGRVQDNPATSRPLLAESMRLFRTAGDRWGLALCYSGLGSVARSEGNDVAARASYEAALALRRAVGHRFSVALTLHWLADLARLAGDTSRAAALAEESLALFRQMGNTGGEADSLYRLGQIAEDRGDWTAAGAAYREALALHQDRGQPGAVAGCLERLAGVAIARGDPKEARALLEEARLAGRDVADRMSRSHRCIDQAHLFLSLGDYAAARALFEEGLALRRGEENHFYIAWALCEAGHAAWLQGQPAVTRAYAREALALWEEPETDAERNGQLAALECLGVAALAQGEKERAAQLLGAVEAGRAALCLTPPAWWLRCRQRVQETVRGASLEREFAAAWAEGQAMTWQQAVESAMARKTKR